MATGRPFRNRADADLTRGAWSVTTSPAVGPPIPGLTVIEVDGCVNVFNPATQRAVILNETATAVWKLADGTRDTEAVVEALAQRYAVEPAAIRAEVVAAIAELYGEALLAAMLPQPSFMPVANEAAALSELPP
jgi:Coenzyme PQQ synthesis protein D (PqqD)